MRTRMEDRVNGLDTLRFLAACWVIMGHWGPIPITVGYSNDSLITKYANGFYTGFFSAPAAVIVFFVISGFCIHFPYRNKFIVEYKSFLPSRYVRIIIPIAVTHFVDIGLNRDINEFYRIIGWSIFAELCYYTVYPLLHKLSKIISWRKLFFISWIPVFYLWSKISLSSVNYPSFNLLGNTFLGLPCWILGVMLANDFDNFKNDNINKLQIWCWRIFIVFLGGILHHLALQLIIGQPFTLNFFAIICFFWIKKEILYQKSKGKLTFLENFGKWSYSLYLLHNTIPYILQKYSFPFFGFVSNWLIYFLVTITSSYIFYIIIEKPSHNISRKIKELLSNERKS